eukprot:6522470-Prymnesium_polylepis.1
MDASASLWRLKTSPVSRRSRPPCSLPTHPYTPRSHAVSPVPPVPPAVHAVPASRSQQVPAGPSRSQP